MDSSHRDRIAYARVVSGTFERGDVLTHAATGKPFVTKYAQSVFGQQRSTLDSAWPGDVIGLANANALRPGDTLFRDVPVHFPPIPSFSPEHFAVARGTDPSKHKQFRKGIEQLDQEGVVQVLRSDKRGEQAQAGGGDARDRQPEPLQHQRGPHAAAAGHALRRPRHVRLRSELHAQRLRRGEPPEE